MYISISIVQIRIEQHETDDLKVTQKTAVFKHFMSSLLFPTSDVNTHILFQENHLTLKNVPFKILWINQWLEVLSVQTAHEYFKRTSNIRSDSVRHRHCSQVNMNMWRVLICVWWTCGRMKELPPTSAPLQQIDIHLQLHQLVNYIRVHQGWMKSVSSLQRRGVRGRRETRGSSVSECEECEDVGAAAYAAILITMLMCGSANVSIRLLRDERDDDEDVVWIRRCYWMNPQGVFYLNEQWAYVNVWEEQCWKSWFRDRRKMRRRAVVWHLSGDAHTCVTWLQNIPAGCSERWFFRPFPGFSSFHVWWTAQSGGAVSTMFMMLGQCFCFIRSSCLETIIIVSKEEEFSVSHLFRAQIHVLLVKCPFTNEDAFVWSNTNYWLVKRGSVVRKTFWSLDSGSEEEPALSSSLWDGWQKKWSLKILKGFFVPFHDCSLLTCFTSLRSHDPNVLLLFKWKAHI